MNDAALKLKRTLGICLRRSQSSLSQPPSPLPFSSSDEQGGGRSRIRGFPSSSSRGSLSTTCLSGQLAARAALRLAIHSAGPSPSARGPRNRGWLDSDGCWTLRGNACMCHACVVTPPCYLDEGTGWPIASLPLATLTHPHPPAGCGRCPHTIRAPQHYAEEVRGATAATLRTRAPRSGGSGCRSPPACSQEAARWMA